MGAARYRVSVLALVAVWALASPWALPKLLPGLDPLGRTTAVALVYVLALSVAIGTWWFVRSRCTRVLPMRTIIPSRLQRHDCSEVTWCVLLVFAGLLAVIGLGMLAPFGLRVEPSQQPLSLRLVLLVGAAVVSPIAEEIAFRYVIHRFLRPAKANTPLTIGERLVVTAPALIASSMFFGFTHFMVVDSGVAMLNTMCVGLVLAVTYELSGRLWVPLAIHFFTNFLAQATQFENRMVLAAIGASGLVGLALWAAWSMQPKKAASLG